ncbi:MAG: hypothetical protein O9284_01750 [Steroidobacteraceae bacterium]|jgi:hypothetical protein|nr:hypothetical protein [Steroidobacteraceae bacterium]
MTTLAALKSRLIELAAATDMRFEATKDDEKEIQALAAEVEAQNPTRDAAQRAELLDGRWRLLYSSFRLTREATLARLSFNKLPEITVRVEGIYQEVGSQAGHYNNLVHFSHGEVRGVQATKGRFRPATEQRLEIEFYGTDVFPEDRKVPPARFAGALGTSPDRLAAPLETQGLWSDVVYLDGELRLMRGAYRNLYVLVREPHDPVSF